MRKLTKRDFFHLCGAGAAVSISTQIGSIISLGPEKGEPFPAMIRGKRVWLSELRPNPSVVHAQYAYYPYQYQNPYSYYGQYQMWAAGQWYQQQYQAYMQQLIQRYTWAQSYVSPMASYMQQYSNSYSLSEPFAMDSIESLYSYGDGDPSTDDLVLGINRNGNRVLARGKSVKLMSAISDIAKAEDFDTDEQEESAGPQSSSRLRSAAVGDRTVAGSGFRTVNGEAFVSSRRYENRDSGESGSIVMFDTAKGKEVRLVEV